MLEQTDIIPAEKQLAASVCTEIAHIYVDKQDYDKAIHYYKEGLGFVENDPKVRTKSNFFMFPIIEPPQITICDRFFDFFSSLEI